MLQSSVTERAHHSGEYAFRFKDDNIVRYEFFIVKTIILFINRSDEVHRFRFYRRPECQTAAVKNLGKQFSSVF